MLRRADPTKAQINDNRQQRTPFSPLPPVPAPLHYSPLLSLSLSETLGNETAALLMASAVDGHINRGSRSIRRLLHLKKRPEAPNPPERNLLIPAPPPSPPRATKKKGFAFRGLGCASSLSSQASAPAASAVRSSADWEGKRPRRRRAKQNKKKERPSPAADVCCAPGMAFAADAPVDCVVSHHHNMGRGRQDSERAHRERSCINGRGSNRQHISSFMDSSYALEAPLFGSHFLSPRHHRHLRGHRRSSGGIEEIMMFQTRLLLGAMDVYDQHSDMRLDVDSMSYEELLELGDRIGYVSTGLREDEIFRCLRKTKQPFFGASPFYFSSEMEKKCSICQEEYKVNDEMGRLECGHSYHIYCIKQWLLQKNACPVCKTAATKG